MPKNVTVLRVLVSSPGDVKEERMSLGPVVDELNKVWLARHDVRLELVNWETDVHPGIGDYPQAVINEQFGEDYDIFIGCMWTRFGHPTGGGFGSGTEEEFERAYSRFKATSDKVRIMFYF